MKPYETIPAVCRPVQEFVFFSCPDGRLCALSVDLPLQRRHETYCSLQATLCNLLIRKLTTDLRLDFDLTEDE